MLYWVSFIFLFGVMVQQSILKRQEQTDVNCDLVREAD